jgi:hypothetical protein
LRRYGALRFPRLTLPTEHIDDHHR